MAKFSSQQSLKMGRYDVRSAVVDGKPKTHIYLGKKKVAEFSESTLDATMEKAKSWANSESTRLLKARRADHIASQEEYEQYFDLNGVADHEREMLSYHAAHPDSTMTEIADALRWEYSAANLHYGTLGAKIARELNLQPRTRDDGSEIGISVIGSDGERRPNGQYVLSMHPELTAALKAAGIAR